MTTSAAHYTRDDLDRIATIELGLEEMLSEHGLWTADRKLDKRIGHTSSWAVWPSPATIGTGPLADWISRSGSQDVLGLEDDGVLERLHPDCVFLALNKGKPEKTDSTADWACFHASAQDAKMPKAIWPGGVGEPISPLWGGYMTDLFKGLPTTSGAGLKAMLRTTPRPYRYLGGREAGYQIRDGVISPLPTQSQVDGTKTKAPVPPPSPEDLRRPITPETRDALLDKMASILATELKEIGADPDRVGFVLLGGDAETYARTLFGRSPLAPWKHAFDRRSAKVPHYSGSVTLRKTPDGKKTYHEQFVEAARVVQR